MKRWFGTVQDQTGRPIQGASVAVYAAGTVTPLSTIFQASGSRTAPASQQNPMTTDANGQYAFAAADGNYDISITGGSIASQTIPNVIFVDELTTFPSPQLGTVTSVSMTVPSIMSVTGSPLTGAGTLAVTLNTAAANVVFAGPTTGAATIPTFRSLVTADFPAFGTAGTYGTATQTPQLTTDATGRVSGVSLVTIAPTFANVSGKPTTLSGYGITDGAALGVQNQYTKSQNVSRVSLTYGATVNTDASLSNVFYIPTNSITAASFTLANPTNLGSGQVLVWYIKHSAAPVTIAFGSKFKFVGGTAPLLSTVGLAQDRLVATYNDVDDILECSLDKGFA
jgi:hypothetical protein